MPYVPYVPCVLWPMSAGLAAYSLCAVCTVVVGGSCAFSVCRVYRDGGRWAGRECRGGGWSVADETSLAGWVCGKGECNDGLAYQLLQAFCRLV